MVTLKKTSDQTNWLFIHGRKISTLLCKHPFQEEATFENISQCTIPWLFCFQRMRCPISSCCVFGQQLSSVNCALVLRVSGTRETYCYRNHKLENKIHKWMADDVILNDHSNKFSFNRLYDVSMI